MAYDPFAPADPNKIEDPVELLKKQNRLQARLSKAQDNLKFKPVTGPAVIRNLEERMRRLNVQELVSKQETAKLARDKAAEEQAAKKQPATLGPPTIEDTINQFNKGYNTQKPPTLTPQAQFTRTGFRSLVDQEEEM